jgi:hypothetical protein
MLQRYNSQSIQRSFRRAPLQNRTLPELSVMRTPEERRRYRVAVTGHGNAARSLSCKLRCRPCTMRPRLWNEAEPRTEKYHASAFTALPCQVGRGMVDAPHEASALLASANGATMTLQPSHVAMSLDHVLANRLQLGCRCPDSDMDLQPTSALSSARCWTMEITLQVLHSLCTL